MAPAAAGRVIGTVRQTVGTKRLRVRYNFGIIHGEFFGTFGTEKLSVENGATVDIVAVVRIKMAS